MKYCEICGQPSGIYDICKNCKEKVENGDVKTCAFCGKYYIPGTKCECMKEQKTIEKEKIIIQHEEPEEEGCFSKGFGGTFGAGCGCVTFIVVMLFLLLLIFNFK